MNTVQQLEALLFASGRAMRLTTLQKQLQVDAQALEEAIAALQERRNTEDSGVHVFVSETEVQLGTAPQVADVVREVLKKDHTGELTRPSVETLAVIAYRGPITKPELEQVRGVNCSVILRNLQIRGLIDEVQEHRMTKYVVSVAFLQRMGFASVQELPDYETLSNHALLEALVSPSHEA